MSESIALEAEQPIAPSSDYLANYLDVFYGTLFHPIVTFKALAAPERPDSRHLLFGLVSVILVSAMAPMIKLANLGGTVTQLWLTVPFSIFSGIVMWCFGALFVGVWAYAFSGNARLRTFLTLSGLATLPWIFMAPATLLKAGLGNLSSAIFGMDEAGVALSSFADIGATALFCLISLVIWLWAVLLLVTAVTESYRLSAEKVVIVIAAPFAMFLVSLGWTIGFILSLRQLLAS